MTMKVAVFITVFLIMTTVCAQGITLIDEKDIPLNFEGVRPDTVLVDGKIYLNLLKLNAAGPGGPDREFYLLVLDPDNDLDMVQSQPLFSGNNIPTDARMTTGFDTSTFWYAYETTTFDPSRPNYLNSAQYTLDGIRPVLGYSRTEIVEGKVLIARNLPPRGSELVDDPLPFTHNGHYYIITRAFEKSVLYVRQFSNSFELLRESALDLSKELGDVSLSVNSLVKINKELFLIAGIFNAPPIFPRSFSHIAAIPLRDDLTTAKGDPFILSDSKGAEYEGYVAGARYKDGKLYILYDILGKEEFGKREHRGIFKVFRVNFDSEDRGNVSDFELIETVPINKVFTPDNHMTLEIDKGKIFVFFGDEDESGKKKLKAKIFQL